MARGKKTKKELSPEEKLQQALVPAEEWPYPIPENWCWVRLGSLCTDIQYGYTAKAIFDNNYPKMLRITDIQGGEVDWDNVPNCEITENDFKKYELVSHDIVFARTGATTGKSCFVLEPPKSVYASYLIRIRLNSSFNKKYVYYILQSEVYWKQIMELSSGIAQPGVNAAKLQSLLCPLSPLSEQQRIVDRIESLFAKLDETKEKAEAVVDGVELRKSAILHKAFTGKLTEWWRKEHGVGLDSWEPRKLKDCGDWYGGGTPSMAHPEYWDNGDLLWITSKDMKSDIIEDTLLRTNMAGVSNSSANYIEKPSILFVMRSGILRRTLPISMVKVPFTVNQDLKAISPVNDLDLEYFYWVCKSLERSMLDTCMKNGTTVESINTKSLMEFKIPIASQPEQKEIVNCIAKLLEKEQHAKEAAEAVLSQIDTMKKAILARAFRGELGTNNPEEEWAGEMVKKIL